MNATTKVRYRSKRLALATISLMTALTCGTCGTPDDYLVDKSTGIGYRLVYQAQTWPVARDRCADEGAKLAVPKTLNEYLFMQKLVRGMQYSSITGSDYKLVVWLGIHNLDDYRIWKNVDGENINETGFHKWSRGNGDGFSDAPEEPHCAGLDAVNWLRDFWCHRRQPYICQIKPI
ncbi:CD209 antigen-like [Pararge aegeria]|uniref:CD209 antigen-like n=1 Tax=Pararge aegeria TaxID=116150 RepID=UPI0019D2E63E|nr:CD209 antigen-like [Pararge aegeria]